MTPALSLEYRHRTRGGSAGRRLVHRRPVADHALPRTVAQDGVSAAPLRSTADRFCLDGQRLVVVGRPATRHRTRSTARKSSPSRGSAQCRHLDQWPGASSWSRPPTAASTSTARRPTRRIDGVQGPSTGGARTWALNRIRDRSGNVIDYRYTEESVSTAFRIASIRYNANPSSGVVGIARGRVHIRERGRTTEVDAGYLAGIARAPGRAPRSHRRAP